MSEAFLPEKTPRHRRGLGKEGGSLSHPWFLAVWPPTVVVIAVVAALPQMDIMARKKKREREKEKEKEKIPVK